MDLMEVLFTCDACENQVSCAACDFRTSTNLLNYKGGGSIQKRTLNLLKNQYLIAANISKPLLHVWPINHQEQVTATRFVVPGRVDALALAPDCCFLVAGIGETLYIWQLITGRMMNMISKHYQPITCIRFTDRGSHFASASRDGGVLVWNLTQVVSRSSDDSNQTPLYSFNDHGLPVTDVFIGYGGLRGYMFTCSLDRSCKVYDLSNGTLLLSVIFSEALHSIITNAMETCVYVGTGEGNIYEFHIDSLPRIKEYHMENDHCNKFSGHKQGTVVSCLVLSLDGHTLISGGDDEQVCVWNIQSRQLLKTLQHKGYITNLLIRPLLPSIFDPEYKPPQVFGGSLRRMLDPPEADDDEIMEILVTKENTRSKRQTYREIIGTASSFNDSPPSYKTEDEVASEPAPRIDESDKIKELNAEIERLKKVNKELYEAAIHKTLFND